MSYREDFEALLGQEIPSGRSKINVLCPFHEDRNPSMSLDLDRGLWYCHACHEGGGIAKLADKLDRPDIAAKYRQIRDVPPTTRKPTAKKSTPTYSLAEYSQEKHIPQGFLQSHFRIGNGDNCIVMPYLDREGKPLYNRYRSANKKMWFDKGITVQPYGLWLLNDVKDKSRLWIVEGESDTQTLWLNGIPAIGIPGINNLRADMLENLQDFDEWVFVIENDKGGIEFLNIIYSLINDYFFDRLSRTYIVLMSDLGKKDINDIWLLKQDRKFFLRKMSILSQIKMLLPVAYQDFIQRKKWVDPEVRPISVVLLQQIKACMYDDRLWAWDNERREYVVVQNPDKFYRSFLIRNGINKPHKLVQVRQQLETFIASKEIKLVPIEWIHFKNISVNFKTLQTRQFDDDYFVTNRIPFNYNPDVHSKLIDEMFELWVEDPEILYKMIGYTFIRGYPENKFFILFGTGGNGKTTFLWLLESLLNGFNVKDRNTSNLSLDAITADRFSGAQLYGKLANIAGEMKYDRITNTKELKDFTGESSITTQRKFQDHFSFVNYAKLIFATNKVPATTDTSRAFYRRVVIIPFLEIPADKKDPLIKEKVKPIDMDYLATKSFHYLHQLYKEGFEFMPIEKSKKMYEDLSNPVKFYITINCEITGNSEDYIPTTELIADIKTWLKKNNQPTIGAQEIYGELKEMGIEKAQVTIYTGRRTQAFIGIRYKVEEEASTDDVPF